MLQILARNILERYLVICPNSLKFHNDSFNMSVNILEGNYVTDFVNKTAKTCSYGLEISGIIETNIYFKTYFHVFGIFIAGWISAFKSIKEIKALNKIPNTFVAFQ